VNELEAAAEQLRQVHEGPAWHGPSMREILNDVDAKLAAHRPPGGAHSIWELVLHVLGWEDVIVRRLHGEVITDVPPDRDFPPAGTGDKAWRELIRRLDDGNRRLRDAIRAFPQARLGETVPGRDYDFSIMLRGAAQHSAYHAGQIAVLKKVVGQSL
jgi:uncharacterized damage-inducible protein DinB